MLFPFSLTVSYINTKHSFSLVSLTNTACGQSFYLWWLSSSFYSCVIQSNCDVVCHFPHIQLGFSWCSDGKASVYNAGDPGLIPRSGRTSGEGTGNLLQYSWLENPIGWRSLVGCSPWGQKGSDTIERLHFTYSISQWHFCTFHPHILILFAVYVTVFKKEPSHF